MATIHDPSCHQESDGITCSVHLKDGRTVELTQIRFTDNSTEHVDSFSVVFEGPADPVLEQGTYQVDHPKAETGPVFLVPLHGHTGRPRYELVVSVLNDAVTQDI